MTDAVVARIERVTHRYGKTFALNDLTLDIPARCMVGMVGPRGASAYDLASSIEHLGDVSGQSPIFLPDGISSMARSCRYFYEHDPFCSWRTLLDSHAVAYFCV